ncbi:Acyl-CoA hydrolase [hydrothermal vent metagenome]|uniref:Acyl-CoA hydrolase n=2 Tax=hydrothermal vent metagenome TaxID=652676 RepID=A0A3B1C3X7_9ZZZZ
MMSDEYPKNRSPITRVLTMPSNANATGDIFGGWILAQVDIAGAILAAERAQGRIVTVAVNSVHFKKPVFVGDVVSFFCEILKIGNTSITVLVEVFAERIPGIKDKVTEAEIVYVAVDENRKPRPVPVDR